MPEITPGGALAAADALTDPARVAYDRAQVAYLMALAYRLGLTAQHTAAVGDLRGRADLEAARRDHETMVAERVALFEACAARINAELGRAAGYSLPSGTCGVDWLTGRPLHQLRAAA